MNFVSEKEILENREKFGIKVDGEDEHYDPRPLYEKLQEKKALEEDAFKDRFKSKPPKAIDDDEYGFLEEQTIKQQEMEKQIRQQDNQLIEEFSKEQSHLNVSEPEKPHPILKKTPEKGEIPKTSILKGRPTFSLRASKRKSNSLLSSIRVIKKDKNEDSSTKLSEKQTSSIKQNIEKNIIDKIGKK